jgi:hypothetical protein
MGVRSALLIGTTAYDDQTLSGLKAPAADVQALAEVLRAPDIGGFEVEVLIDRASSELMLQIARFFAKRLPDDVLLFYFSGHGVLDDVRELHLAAKNTEREILSASAVSSSFVRSQMERSKAKSQIVLLDCCHGGAFNAGAKGAGLGEIVDTESVFGIGTPGQGRVILTASSSTQYAFDGETLVGQPNLSLFTHYIVEGLRTGEADQNGDGQITGDELFEYVNARVQAAAPTQKPTSLIKKDYGEIVLGRSAIIRPSLDLIPPSIVTALKSASGFERRGAIMSLLDLVKALPPQGIAAARQILQQIAEEDDSVMVRRDAGMALTAIPVPTASTVAAPATRPPVPGTWPPAAGTWPPVAVTRAPVAGTWAPTPASVARPTAATSVQAGSAGQPVQAGAPRTTAIRSSGPSSEFPRAGRPWKKLVSRVALGVVLGSLAAVVGAVSKSNTARDRAEHAGQAGASGGASAEGAGANGDRMGEQPGQPLRAGAGSVVDVDREAQELYEQQALPILGQYAGPIHGCLDRGHFKLADDKAVLHWTVSDTGSVSEVTIEGDVMPDGVETCLKRVVRGSPLPVPPSSDIKLPYNLPPRSSRLAGRTGDSPASEARRLSPAEREAIEVFVAGRYEDALNSYAKLYAETLNPTYLRNIGRCYQRLRRPDSAIEKFRDYLAGGKDITTGDRAEVMGYIREMEDLRERQNQPTVKAPDVGAPLQRPN